MVGNRINICELNFNFYRPIMRGLWSGILHLMLAFKIYEAETRKFAEENVPDQCVKSH